MSLEDIPDNLIKLALVLISVAILAFPCGVLYQKWQENRLERQPSVENGYQRLFLKANVLPYHLEMNEIGYRVVTAYNPVPNQTDNTPCISASGINVCETSKNIVATNEFAFGTMLKIDGKIWEVQDRMNIRYSYRIDLLMEDYREAKDWGKRTLKIELVN